MDISKRVLERLSDEVKGKINACETPADLVALAESEGAELSDEQMEMVSGGAVWDDCFDCSKFACQAAHSLTT